MGEASLVEQAKSGNKDALLELIMNQKDEYYRLAYVYLGNPDDALDILQDTIVTLYQNIRKLRKNEVFHSWAKTILVNLCKNQLKRKKRIISLEAVSNVNLYSNINLSKHSSARSNLSSHLDLKIEPASKTPASICGLTSKKEQMIDKEIPISAHSKKVEIGTGDVYFSIENVSLKDGKTYLEIKRKNNVETVFGLFAADKSNDWFLEL
ncbi:RNA polymerase sigma factor [Paradesulfitobacterium ferrireducens]|uniref:RNA polymerase sigma factor n=1 Tax=Paradesulfitobacterium ferrireducens TaxID=2816476 RepID=UPI001A8D66CC|nr:RNA polymerase sigma factor [Paradesulfitobacterium ferrireducens]